MENFKKGKLIKNIKIFDENQNKRNINRLSKSPNKDKFKEKAISKVKKNSIIDNNKRSPEKKLINQVLGEMPYKNLPKNVNEYRHIIDNKESRDSDVKWILELRAYKAKKSYLSLKDSEGLKPELYTTGLEEYRNKVLRDLKERKENEMLLKGNSRDFEHLMNRRIGEQSNPYQLGFDSTLRKSYNDKNGFENVPWRTLAISPKKSLLSLYLPPMSKNSLENLQKIKKYVSHPFEQIEDISSVNGSEIRRRKFIPSLMYTSIPGGEHNSSPNYNLKYNLKNLGGIRHLLEQQNNSLTHWESDLRNYNYKKNLITEVREPPSLEKVRII